MKIFAEQLKEDIHRDLYWTRISVKSEDNKNETIILVCASHEYLWDKLKSMNYTKDQLSKWLSEFLKEIESEGEKIFNNPLHYRVFATTSEGIKNGHEFLENEVN